MAALRIDQFAKAIMALAQQVGDTPSEPSYVFDLTPYMEGLNPKTVAFLQQAMNDTLGLVSALANYEGAWEGNVLTLTQKEVL